MKKIATKIISDKKTCDKLVALIKDGKAQAVKEFLNGEPAYLVFSASGSQIGAIAKKWQYLFAATLSECGSGDGLWPGLGQTAGAPCNPAEKL